MKPPRRRRAVPAACKDHPSTAAIGACASCAQPLCDECFRFRIGGRPGCACCAYEITTRPRRRVSLAVAFLGIAIGLGVWLVRKPVPWDGAPLAVLLGAIAAPVVVFWMGRTARDPKRPGVERRDPEEDGATEELVEVAASGSPYRAGARRVLLAASPRLSGRATALVFGASLAATAVLVPAELRLPRWIQAEVVLGLWWLIVAATLVTLLYRGFRLKDDHAYFSPWNRPKAPDDAEPRTTGSATKSKWLESTGCAAQGCAAAPEGCLMGIAAALALGVAFGAAWVIVELAMPVLFFVVYALFMKAIGRVARDRHECAGRPGASVGWGALWATIYVAPIAALAWGVHALR